MKRLCFSAAVILGLTRMAFAADASPTTMAPQTPAPATLSAPIACDNAWDFVTTGCRLSWYGITVYGTVDMGVGWQSHGTPFNTLIPQGVEYLISKNSNRSLWLPSPNALSQSNIGLKGNEEFAPGWSFIFNLETGFDPFSGNFANGPGSIAQNAGVPLNAQTSNTDSSRAGQLYNSVGYMGVSSPTFGTLTVFRQNSLTLDGVIAYDPMGASYAFSPIGYQGTTCGVGDTEDCRFTTAAKYRVNVGPLRVGALLQFGGYSLNNAADGAYQVQLGGDIHDVGGGAVSLDGIYSYVKDAVSIGLAGNPALGGVPVAPFLPQTLTATISDDTSVMLLAKYATGPLHVYAGYEWIQYAPPSNPQTSFTDIAGNFLCLGCTAINNTNISNTAFSPSAGFGDKHLQVVWTGIKYGVTDDLDLIGAYYHYYQGSYFTTNCSSQAHAQCAGTFNAVSALVDWRFAPKFDAYGGLMFSQVNGGLANGYLHHSTVDPTVGLRFRF